MLSHPRRCKELSQTQYREDALIVAGDVSDDLAVLRTTLRLLAARWKHVFFTPGNHDLWTRRAEWERYDSLGELDQPTLHHGRSHVGYRSAGRQTKPSLCAYICTFCKCA